MTADAALFPPIPARAEPAVTPAPAPAEPLAEPAPDSPIGRLESLMRDPTQFLDATERGLDDPAAAASLARVLLAAITVGAGIFGAVVGAHRGGLQVVWCAVKVPLILVLTLVVCTPAFVALARAAGLSLGARGVITLSLASCARFALVLLGLAPIVWLAQGWSMGYHRVILAVVAVCAVAGVAAVRLTYRGLARAGAAGARVAVAVVTIFALVGAQTSWILRPFVVRPRTAHVPFVRALEGDFLAAVVTSARSAVIYSSRATPSDVRSTEEGP
jgi:hypothetical protein